MTETILEEAARLTSEDRRKTYGHPAIHHGATAACINAYLTARDHGDRAGQPLDARDWEWFIILDKSIRDAHARKRDNLVDVAGYARTAELSQEILDANGTEANCDTAKPRMD